MIISRRVQSYHVNKCTQKRTLLSTIPPRCAVAVWVVQSYHVNKCTQKRTLLTTIPPRCAVAVWVVNIVRVTLWFYR